MSVVGKFIIFQWIETTHELRSQHLPFIGVKLMKSKERNSNAQSVIDNFPEEMTDCWLWWAAADALFADQQVLVAIEQWKVNQKERFDEHSHREWVLLPAGTDWQVTERASSIRKEGKASRPMRNESAGVNLAPSCSPFSNKVVAGASSSRWLDY